MGDPITIPVIGLGRIFRVGVIFGFLISAGLGGAGSGGCFRFLCWMVGFRNFGLIFVILVGPSTGIFRAAKYIHFLEHIKIF